MSEKAEEIDGEEGETEYTVVPPEERLDYDEDGSEDTDALDGETGDDQAAIDQVREIMADDVIWEGE